MAPLKNRYGFTLVEALVSIFILAVILLGLLSSLIIVYEQSTKNLIRDEAVKIAQEYAEKMKNMGFDNIPQNQTDTLERKIRNKTVEFTVKISSKQIAAGSMKDVTITVEWEYKGKKYSHKLELLVGKNE